MAQIISLLVASCESSLLADSCYLGFSVCVLYVFIAKLYYVQFKSLFLERN